MIAIIALWIILSSAAFLLWYRRRVRALEKAHAEDIFRQLARMSFWTGVASRDRIRRLEELLQEQEEKLAHDLAGSGERSAQLEKLKQRVDQLQRSLWGDVQSQVDGWIEWVH